MDLQIGWTHTTFSAHLLLAIASVIAIVVTRVAIVGSRTRSLWLGRIAAVAAILGTSFVVLLAGEHIPLVAVVAPQTFCFGDIGLEHLVAFALPLIGLVTAKGRNARRNHARAAT